MILALIWQIATPLDAVANEIELYEYLINAVKQMAEGKRDKDWLRIEIAAWKKVATDVEKMKPCGVGDFIINPVYTTWLPYMGRAAHLGCT